jgi:hypothetical protein
MMLLAFDSKIKNMADVPNDLHQSCNGLSRVRDTLLN